VSGTQDLTVDNKVDGSSTRSQQPTKNSSRARFLSSNLVRIGAAGIVLLASAYAVGTGVAYFSDGPDSTVDRIAQSLLDMDSESLADPDLWPNPNNIDVASPELLSQIKGPTGGYVSSVDWEPSQESASAKLAFESGETFELSLTSSFGWYGVFPGRTWSVAGEPTVLNTTLPDFLPVETEIRIEAESLPLEDLLPIVDRNSEVLVFPGQAKVSVQQNELLRGATIEHDIPHADTSELILDSRNLQLSVGILSKARTEAKGFADDCAKNECGSLPYISVSWVPYSPSSYYDNRVRTDSYSSEGCALADWSGKKENAVELTFSCDIERDATELQVTYYTYISDEYDYYIGSGFGEMEVVVEAGVNENGEVYAKRQRQ
jgi:hypothetical protein